MRRIVALVAALVLVGTLTGSSLGSSTAPRNSFQGSFDLETEEGELLGHAIAQLFEPTEERLVPGRYDFTGADDNWIRESHAVIGNSGFWFDPGHMPNGATIPGGYVARGEGVECVYAGPNETDCHTWAVQFVDNVDPSVRDEVHFEGSWGVVAQFVRSGSFIVSVAGE
ncbi:MAG TPA: hypothetical protein VFY23_00125 [Candidatus Limnocylindrales bacterium]|nr:hypothetical protein [Candidatus Limnocylindrales bacterium]